MGMTRQKTLLIIGILIISMSMISKIDGVSGNNSVISTSDFNPITLSPNNQTVERSDGTKLLWEYNTTNLGSITYSILVNATPEDSGEIKQPNSGKFQYNVDTDRPAALYNFTLNATFWYDDNTNITIADSAFINIMPPEAPELLSSHQSPINVEYGNLYRYLNWTFSDLSANNYSIFKDQIKVDEGTWVSNSSIIYHDLNVTIDESYNYTITVADSIISTSDTSHSIIITVIENPVPKLQQSSNSTQYAKSMTGKEYVWEFSDNDLQNYSLYIDTTILLTGLVPDNKSVSVDLDGLTYGTYNLTIVVQDEINQTLVDTQFIEIIDVVAPSLSIDDTFITVTYSEPIPVIGWMANDDNPFTYQLYHNGTEISNGFWDSEVPIDYTPTINKIVGVHNFTMIISDSYQNTAAKAIYIEVVAIETEPPVIEIADEAILDSKEVVSGSWESNGSVITNAEVYADLYHDNRIIHSETGFIDENGNLQMNLTYTDVTPDDYMWTIQFIKTGYNTQTLEENVTIVPVQIKIDYIYPSTLVQGEEYQIQLRVSYDYSQKLSIDRLIMPEGSVSDMNLTILISIVDSNGETRELSRTGITNSSGFVEFSLSSQETEEVVGINGFSVTASQSYIIRDGGQVQIGSENVKVIPRSQDPQSPPSDSNGYFGEVLVVILTLLLASAIGSAIVYYIFYNPIQNLPPEEHLDHIQSVQMIIWSNLDGLPLFEKYFAEIRTDSTLVAGLSTAISSFLDEFIENADKGIEIIERDDLSIVSHRSNRTVLTVVSKPKLPKRYEDLIIKTHTKILDDIPLDKLEQNYTSSRDNFDDIVLDALHLYGIRVKLLEPFSYSADKFIEFLSHSPQTIPNIVSRQKDVLSQLNLIDITLMEFFEIIKMNTELDDNEIANLLFTLDDLNLIIT